MDEREWRKLLRQMERSIRAVGEEEARRRMRELGFVFVKEYTVRAHFYKYKRKR